MPAAVPAPALRYCEVFPRVLRAEACCALIGLAEEAGFVPARLEGAQHGPRGFEVTAGRECDRAAIEDDALATSIWMPVSRHAPHALGHRHAAGLNERLRFYRYDAGQGFPRHRDGCYRRAGAHSLLTLLIFLNDDFEGGETCFEDSGRVIRPAAGTAVLFAHRLWHEGRAVRAGRKYVLRTDVMYTDESMRPSGLAVE